VCAWVGTVQLGHALLEHFVLGLGRGRPLLGALPLLALGVGLPLQLAHLPKK